MALSNQHGNLSPDFQLTFDDWDGYFEEGVRETVRAVTGADGRLLTYDIDLSPSIEPPASKAKDPPRFRQGLPPWMCELPPRPPLRVRNKITGNEFDWDPIFTMNEDLEVIA